MVQFATLSIYKSLLFCQFIQGQVLCSLFSCQIFHELADYVISLCTALCSFISSTVKLGYRLQFSDIYEYDECERNLVLHLKLNHQTTCSVH